MKRRRTHNFYRTMIIPVILAALLWNTCASGNVMTSSNPGTEGVVIINNESGLELAVFVRTLYGGIVETGRQITIPVDRIESVGTDVEIEVIERSKLRNLREYPGKDVQRYDYFVNVVRPLNNPTPVTPIQIRKRSSEELANNVTPEKSVLVRFSYHDWPQVRSTVSVFTGAVGSENPIIRLNNGDPDQLVPMPVGGTFVSVRYTIANRSGITNHVYPQYGNINQMNDNKFFINVFPDHLEVEFNVPRLDRVFSVSREASSPATNGTLRVINNSSVQINIRSQTGTEAADRPIMGVGNNSLVTRENQRNFIVSPGRYNFRAAMYGEETTSIARLENIGIEPGMIYTWYVSDQRSAWETRVNMDVPREIRNLFQSWIFETKPEEVNMFLRITSTANEVQNGRYSVGRTARNGQLNLPDRDIENIIRGLTTDNARRVLLTFEAEKEGYYSVSQAISAADLLNAGSIFRPQVFELERIQENPNADIIIGDPLIN